MRAAELVELRLTSFKSFHGAKLPLGGATILTGRNSTGKSNALDGLEVLARLAQGEDLADALDGRRREGGAVRGGSAGCAPHGTDRFELGCSVSRGGARYDYDVCIEVRPDLRVVSERLYGPGRAVKSGKVTYGPLVETREPGAPGTGIIAELHNGKQGVNSPHTFRDSRLIIGQVPLAVAGSNRAEESLLEGAETVLTALRGVFHLDPVPHLMRSFVPNRDSELRRTGENISPALLALSRRDNSAFDQLQELVRKVADDRVEKLSFVSSDLGDVMFALDEKRGTDLETELTPAREMSDGLLRFTAIATTLLSPRQGLDVDANISRIESKIGHEDPGSVLIVIEELENGLHPSQAARVLELVRTSSAKPATSVLVTTHSPALLDAAEGRLTQSVVVCYRDPGTGYSMLTRLVDLPGYAAAMAESSLGRAVTAGKLVDDAVADRDYGEFEKLLGLR